MYKKAKRISIMIIASLFLALGLVGLLLPFIQGLLLILIGLMLLSLCFPEIRYWINKHTLRYPRLFPLIQKIESWIVKIVGEV